MRHEPIDPKLTEFATVRQLEYIDAINANKSTRKAAAMLKVNERSVTQSMAALKKYAATKGYSPEHDMTRTAPVGFGVKGTSTLYNKDGQISSQWVKTQRDEAQQERALKDFAKHLAESVIGLAPIVPAPKSSDADTLCVYPMGDPHFGMYAWWQDAGEDFDLDIAENLTCGAIDRLISSAPASHMAILLNLGDMFHSDNQRNVTNSGHQLDVDGRWAKVQKVGLQAMIYAINRLLEKHQKVIFRINRGNHDGHSSYALALMVSCYFHKELRVEVDLSPATAWYYQFGKVLIGSTHGDTLKGPAMVGLMAADQAVAWGGTKHRYWYVGHVHHQDTKEYPGGIVEYFRTLAARDAWHAGQGYRAGRDMRLIVLHREHGEIERHRCDVAMLDVSKKPDFRCIT